MSRRSAQQDDDDDLLDERFIYFGTQLVDEQEAVAGQHAKEARDPAAQRSLPVWKQEVTDEQGRRRFHGAFEGGFSAGHFNTVGSVEGFQPAAFRSSRTARAQPAQSIDDFLDKDELEERQKASLHVQDGYDTFGHGAAERARRDAQRDADQRPSLIPGPVLDDLVVPVADSIGIRLLQLMGWRPGRGVGTSSAQGAGASSSSTSKWGTVAGVSLDNTPVYVLEPKMDAHGLGFDPFADAEEFRHAKRQQAGQVGHHPRGAAARGGGVDTGSLRPADAAAARKRGAHGIAFGTGALEETDTLGYVEDYIDPMTAGGDDDDDGMGVPGSRTVARRAGQRAIGSSATAGGTAGGGGRAGPRALALTGRAGYSFELASDEEDDEDRFTAARRGKAGPLLLTADVTAEQQLLLQSKGQLRPGGSFVAGFVRVTAEHLVPPKAASVPPNVPHDFVERHVFPADVASTATTAGQGALPPPPDVPPPEDEALRRAVDSLAAQVARSGSAVEDLARRRATQAGGHFAFLLGGPGSHYYVWRLHKIKAALAAVTSRPSSAPPTTAAGTAATLAAAGGTAATAGQRQYLTIEQRMALLGETPLASTSTGAATSAALLRAEDLAGRTAAAALRDGGGATVAAVQVAEGDKRRLQDALQSSFVASTTAEMGLDREGQQYGLRPGAASVAKSLPPAAAAAMLAFADRFSSGSTFETSVLPPGPAGGLQQPVPAAAATAVGAALPAVKRPVRTAEDWRPEPLLCRRLNVPDPYAGKPLPQQMSKYKSDYVALPDTNAAIIAAARAAAAAMTDAHQQQQQQQQALPPPPPLPAHIEQQAHHALPPPPPMPSDAKTLAANFLASLDFELPSTSPITAPASMAPPPPPSRSATSTASLPPSPPRPANAPPATAAALSAAGQTAAVATAAVTGQPLDRHSGMAEYERSEEEDDGTVGTGPLNKPLDLFKAIFEASDAEEEDEEPAGQPAATANAPSATAAPVAAAAAAATEGNREGNSANASGLAPPDAGGTKGDSVVPPAPAMSRAQERARGLADALMRAQEISATRAQEARVAQAAVAERQRTAAASEGAAGPSGAAGGTAGGTAGVTAAAALDAATHQRIREALGMVRKQDDGSGSKSRSKDKKNKKKRKKSTKHSKRDGGKERASKTGKGNSDRAKKPKHQKKRRRQDEPDEPATAKQQRMGLLSCAPPAVGVGRHDEWSSSQEGDGGSSGSSSGGSDSEGA